MVPWWPDRFISYDNFHSDFIFFCIGEKFIYYNYTTICRKIQVCIFFFDRKINFLRCHLCNKMSFSWIPEFFRKERTGVFHLSISITEHHFHVEPDNFSEKKKPDIPLNCDISGFSHSFEVRIFNCQKTLILIQCTCIKVSVFLLQ